MIYEFKIIKFSNFFNENNIFTKVEDIAGRTIQLL